MIYLKLDKEPESIEELMTALFSYKVSPLTFKSVKTYRDKECTIPECPADKYRSVDDVVEIVQTYFPEATEKTILRTLIKLKIEKHSRTYRLNAINCCDIKRPTIAFYSNPKPVGAIDPQNQLLTYSKLVNSKYKTWRNVMEIAELKYSELD